MNNAISWTRTNCVAFGSRVSARDKASGRPALSGAERSGSSWIRPSAINPSNGSCNAFRFSWTERSVIPSRHHRQTRPAAVAAKTASAHPCTVPKATVVSTIITQIVRNASRLASVCRRVLIDCDLGLATAADGVRCWSAAAADSLEAKVVIPDIAKDRTNRLFVIARIAIERDQNSVFGGLGFEIHGYELPIKGTRGERRRP